MNDYLHERDRRLPSAPVWLARSAPARSTKFCVRETKKGHEMKQVPFDKSWPYEIWKEEALKKSAHQMGHNDGAVSIFTRHWVTSLSALQDLGG